MILDFIVLKNINQTHITPAILTLLMLMFICKRSQSSILAGTVFTSLKLPQLFVKSYLSISPCLFLSTASLSSSVVYTALSIVSLTEMTSVH